MKYKKILLNIPHSGVVNYSDGWSCPASLFNKDVKKMTDWHTDYLFGDTLNKSVESVVFPYSRFYVDVERLVNDPMETIGQGIIYTRYRNNTRTVTKAKNDELMDVYNSYHTELASKVIDGTMVIDCHSFPSSQSAIEICIGYNDDDTKPSDDVLNLVYNEFKSYGYEVRFNAPYSNSIAPKTDAKYSSFMIEVNKKCYMNEETLELNNDKCVKLKFVIESIYSKILNYE